MLEKFFFTLLSILSVILWTFLNNSADAFLMLNNFNSEQQKRMWITNYFMGTIYMLIVFI